MAEDLEASGYNNLPSYMVAADSHNVAESGGNFSFLDPNTWYEGLSNAGKFITASVVSGAAQLYNTGVATGNFFGADLEEMDTAATMANLDSDLGQYYVNNQAAVDVGGFIAGSFVPGLGSMKMLQAAKAGAFGTNMARATGLLVPETENLILTAGRELANRQATFRAFDANVLRAFGAGLQGAAAESIVAEAAVAATMYKSPVLEDMSIADLGVNIFWGGVFGTAVGGAINSARIYGGVKKLVTAAETGENSLKAVQLQTAMPKSASEADRIIARNFDLERVATAQVDEGILTAETVARERAATIRNLKDSNRLSFQTMASGDSDLANTIADAMDGAGAQQHFQSLYGAKEIGRLGKKLKGEADAAEFQKAEALATATDSAVTATPATTKIGYVPLFGRTAGQMTFDAPIPTRLADTVSLPTSDKDKLKSVLDSYGFKPGGEMDTTSAVKADAQYLWAEKTVQFKDKMAVDEGNIPVLSALIKQLAAKNEPWQLTLKSKGGTKVVSDLGDLIAAKTQAQETLAKQLLSRRKKITIPEVASITNLSEDLLLPLKNRTDFTAKTTDYDYRAGLNKSYTDMMRKKGLHTKPEDIDVSAQPLWAKVGYDTAGLDLPSQFEYDAMAMYATKWQMYEADVNRAISSVLGDSFPQQRLVKITDYDLSTASRYDAAPGVFSSTNAGYDTLGSKAQVLGIATRDLNNAQKALTDSQLTPSLQRLLADDKAAYEFEVVNKLVSQAPEPYALDTSRGGLVPLKQWKWEQQARAAREAGQQFDVPAPALSEGMKEFVPIGNTDALNAWSAYVGRNQTRYGNMNTLRASQGLIDLKEGLSAPVAYPIRKNYRDYKHFVFVVDEKVTNTGHVSMIHAKDEQQLAALVAKVPEGLKVITKQESELYHKAMGDYDFQRTLHDNYIDTALSRAGVDSEYFLETSPQNIVNKVLEHNYRADRALATEVVRASNEKAFTALEKLGERYDALAGSVTGAKPRTDNPYKDYIRTALNLSTLSEDSQLSSFNTQMDSVFTKFSNAISTALGKVRNERDLDSLNEIMGKYGVKGGYHDAAIAAYGELTPDKGALSTFVQRANSMVSTLALGTDPFHAAANAIGNNVLLGSMTHDLVKAIKKANPEVAGRLALLSEVAIPGTGGKAMLSPSKLIANANKAWFQDKLADGEMTKLYKELGFNPNYRQQVMQLNEDLIINGTESAKVLNGKISKALDKAGDILTKPTTWSEEYTRFTTVNVIKQITDAAEAAGIYTRNESLATINTFLNRVQGNLIASQRPLVMQGPIGMAIGLFQTYQFNLIQQMLRMVAEGAPKDAAMMLGLQGSIFGMNGMPAFNFINTHLVGTASGNSNHRDLYDATYGIAGKEAGDWLMYGIASNLPKLVGAPGTNIYTRGDINPRQLTILPSQVSDIAFVRTGTAIWNGLTSMVDQTLIGAPFGEVLTQALEHNGVSRPLAGIAQVLQAAGNGGVVYSTDNRGVLVGTNDLLSVTSLMRMAGARPMDEAITRDYYFRLKVYDAQQTEMMNNLRQAVRKSVIAGNTVEEDQYGEFLRRYVKAGGDSTKFNKWIMKQYTEANVPATQKLASQLNTPSAQRMQEFLRGRTVTAADLNPMAAELTGGGGE